MIRFRVFKFPPKYGFGDYPWCVQDYFYANLTFHKTWEDAMKASASLGRIYGLHV